MVKTYAWRKAIPSSNIVTAIMTIKGIRCTKYQIPPKESIVQANPAIIFNKVWPDIILANNRIAKLKTRAIYESNSIGTRRGANIKCTPLGKKKPNTWTLCFLTAIIFIPINKVSAKLKVIKIWLVTVKLYGIKPIKLVIIRNKNKKKIKGNKVTPREPIFCSTRVFVNKKISSTTSCQFDGITFVFKFSRWKDSKIILKEIVRNIVEFVILRYLLLIHRRGKSAIMSNCSNGDR